MSTKRKHYDERDDLSKWLQGKTGGTTTQTTQPTSQQKTQATTTEKTASSATSELQSWLQGKGAGTSTATTADSTSTYYRYMEEERKRKQARAAQEQRRTATYSGSNPFGKVLQHGISAAQRTLDKTGFYDAADAKARSKDLDYYTRMYQDAQRTGNQKLADMAKKGYDEAYKAGTQSEQSYQQKAAAYHEEQRSKYDAWQQQNNPGEYYGTRMSQGDIQRRLSDINRTIQYQQRSKDAAEAGVRQSMYDSGYAGGGYDAEMENYTRENNRLSALKEEQARYEAALRYSKDAQAEETGRQYSIDTMGRDEFYRKARAGKARYEADEKAAADRRTDAVLDIADGREDFVINSDEYRKIVNAAGGFSLARDDTTDWGYYDITKFYAMYDDDPESAKAWLRQMKTMRDEQEVQAYADQYGQEWTGRVGAFFMSPAISLASGLDPYGSWGQKASRIAEGMQKGVTEGLTEHGLFDTGALAGEAEIPLLGKVNLGTFAGIGMSMVQSGMVALPAMAIGDEYTAIQKTVEFLGTALMGSSAAASDYREKLKAGWSETDAMTHSLCAGIAEGLFEYVSLDKLVDQDVTRGLIRNFFTQGGVEASEEFCTTVANRLSDAYYARKNGYDTSIEDRAKELVAQGYSYEGAMQEAKHEWYTELINDAFAGFVSGGGMTMMHHAAASVEQAAARKGQRAEYARSMQGTEGAVEAVRKYAADRGLKEVKDSKGSTRQDARQGKSMQAAEEDIAKRMQEAAEKGGVQGANQFYSELVEKYGDGIRSFADAALDSAVSSAVTATTEGRRATAYSVLAHQETVEGIQDERAREVARGAMERAAYMAAMQADDEAQWRRASDYRRNHGQEMTMQATVTNEDGSERQVGIESVDTEAETVKLAGGETVSFDSLIADPDTKDVVHAMLASDMTEEASARMIRTFKAQTAEGMVTDPHSWAMDYVTSYDRGRVGSFSLEKAQQSVDVLHADTVKIAYEAGQAVSEKLTQEQWDKLNAALAIREKGASGRAGSLDVGELAAKIEADEGLKEEVERIRKFAEVFGIDVGLFESGVKNGRYQGENGRYQDGKIWLDINAGRNKVGDVARGMVQTMAHEMTHFMQEYNPEDYAGVKRFVMQQIAAQKGENAIKQLVDKKKQRHTGSKPLSTTMAEDEIVADFCADMLTDKAALETMAREDPKGFQALVQWIKDFMQKVFGKLAGRPAGSYEVQVYRSMEQSLRDAFGEAWGKGIVGAVQTHDVVGSLREAERLGASAQMAEEATVQQSDRLDEETLEFLDNQEHVTVYRAMQLIDGKLYPPMAAKVEGKLVEPTEIGKWYQSVERPDLVKNGKFTLNKGNGTSVPAAYNPYFHCSASPLNDQFSSAYKRPNLVVVEGIIPKSELTSGYKAEGAKNSVGETQWHAGPVASKLKGAKARRVFLSRYFQVTRIMSDAEVAGIVAKTLQGENVSIPSNVVTPSLLAALKEQGAAVDETGIERFKAAIDAKGLTKNKLETESGEDVRKQDRSYDAPSDIDLLEGFSQDDAGNEEQRRLLREAQASGKKLRETQRQLERLRADLQALAGDNPSRITIKDFRRNVLDLFGIPSSERNGDIGNMIQSIAEGVLAGNKMSLEDISFFFQTFVENGTMRTVPNEYVSAIRDELKGRKIYVNDQVKEDLGEDYAALRKRAFGLGVTLTNNSKDMGIDQHWAELSEMYPGAFDSEELDLGTMLDQMISYAESGKASNVSILDGMRQVEEQTGEPVREQLQRMYDSFVRHIEIMEDRGKLEAKARAGNAAEVANAKKQAAKAREELSKIRKERNEWKKKTTSAEKKAADKLQAELRKIVRRDAAQLAEAVRQKEALAKKLQQQVEREQKILTGKLNTPQLAKMLKTARETAAKEMAKHKDEVFARAKDRKWASELRSRIKNLSDEMKRRMTRPTDGAYVPASLYGSMTHLADVLDEFLAPNPGTKAAERYKAMLDGIRRMSSEYAAVADLDDPVYSSEYDKEIKDAIDAIERTLTRNEQSWLDQLTGDTQKSIRELSTAELQHIYELMKSINYSMKNAATSLSWNEGKSIYEAMRDVAAQQQELTPLEETGKFETSKRGRLLRKMSTMRAVEMMSGYQRDAALYQLMHGIEQGVVDADSWVMNYDKAMQPLKNGKNELEYRRAISKKLDFGATTDRGTKVLMTKMQAIQIIMTAEREAHNDTKVHLQKGGAVIRDKSSGKSYTIQVTPELLKNIQNSLTEWDNKYIWAIYHYFEREGKRTNEILYKLKHRVLQTEKYYVPYQVDENYLETKLDKPEAAMSMWVKTPGFVNPTKDNASQPVIIDGMDAVMQHHVREIANYIGLALPIRDFSKVYNGMLSQGEGKKPLPVKETIHRNFGADGQKILTQAVIDIQGGRRGNQHRTGMGKFLEAMQSSFYKTALLINPSVTIKQAASYVAIESILDHRAVIAGNRPIFVKADKSWSPSLIAHLFAAPSGATAMRLYNEIDAHTSMHYMRRQGMSMRELASQANRSGPIARAKGMVGASMEQAGWIGHKARQAAEAISPLNWIQRMDVATTAAIWVACKEQAKLDGMEVGTDEYWQHVTELYERCLRETQPMYDDLHRNEYQKNQNGLIQYLFPFRTVPIQNHGQLANSYENLLAAHKSGDKAWMKAANRFFRKTVAAQTMSAAVFSVMTFLAAALKRKTKKYRDDDEEISAETIGIGIGKDVIGTLISVISPMFGSEMWESANYVYDTVRTGKAGRTYDSFSVGVVDLLNELISKSTDVATDFFGVVAGNDVDKSKFLDHVMALLEAGAKCAGVPYTTIKTYSSGIKDNITDILEGRIPALNDEAADRTNAVNAGRYWKAWVAGDDAKMSTVLDEMIQNYLDDGKDENKAHELTRSALGSAVMDRYTEGELDLQEFSDYMEGTGLWDDEKRQDKLAGIIRDELQAGLRDEDEAIDLLTELCGWDEDKAWKKAKEWSAKAEHADEEDYSYSQYDEIDAAIDANQDIGALVKELTAHGVKAESIRKHVKDYLTNRYVEGSVTETALKNQLSRYCGITVKKDVDEILKNANSRKEFGVKYDDLDSEYRAGKITKTKMKSALMKYGGLDSDEADMKIRWYDLQKNNPSLEITESVCNTWYDGTKDHTQKYGHRSAKAEGMSIAKYVEAKSVLSKVTGTDLDGDGKTDTNSREKAYIQAISGIGGLTAAQRWALYYEEYSGANWKKIAKPNW